jgi:uncharacterized protein
VSASPIEVVSEWLQNLSDPDVIHRLVAPDATYVSLSTENPELKLIEPWAGTSHGPQAFLDNLNNMFSRWENQAFNVTSMFGSGEDVAVFGDFRYRSYSLNKVVSSPSMSRSSMARSRTFSFKRTPTPPPRAFARTVPGRSKQSPTPHRSLWVADDLGVSSSPGVCCLSGSLPDGRVPRSQAGGGWLAR